VSKTRGCGELSLRISVTDRCQLRCLYCMPPEGILRLPRENVLTFEEILRFVRAVRKHFTVTKVHLTGGEPLIRRGIVELVNHLAAEGIGDLALTTNGIQLAEMAAGLKRAGLRRININLPTLDAQLYAMLTRGGAIASVLAGIAAARAAGFYPVKLNVVVLRGLNDGEVTHLARFALENSCVVRFLELMPLGCAQSIFAARFVPTAAVRSRLAAEFRLRPCPTLPGGTSCDFVAESKDGLRGAIGFISSCSKPFCRGCRRIRLTSTGEVIGCLSRGQSLEARDLLRANGDDAAAALATLLMRALAAKGRRPVYQSSRLMACVGG